MATGGRIRQSGNGARPAAARVEAAATALRAAQPDWEAIGARERAAFAGRFRDWVIANDERLAAIVQEETGKPRQDADIELLATLDIVNYYAAKAPGFLAPETVRPHSLPARAKSLEVAYRPHPLVGIITPWNFPALLVMIDALPALLAGCAVLVKPSELTPGTAAALARGWAEIGAPPVWAVEPGEADAGAAVVDAADFVQFTGSAATGRAIMERAARTLTPVSLELGGKDAMIVCADADLERAANGAVYGAMFNSGQTCVAVERVYVEDAVHDEFVELVVERAVALRQGRAGGYDTDLGEMTSDAQLRVVREHVEDALGRGARALTGGAAPAGAGRAYPPTVLVDVDHSMRCMREETFGPTLPVMRVSDEDEAIGLANESDYGLSASVWTRDAERARRIARRLEAGTVNVNDVMSNLFQPAIPMGGWKSSGIGSRLGGAAGVRRFCRVQALSASRMTPTSEPGWFPYGGVRGPLLRHLLRVTSRRPPDPRRAVAGIVRSARGMLP